METTIIIPIHEVSDKIFELYDGLMESIERQEGIKEIPNIILVFPTKLREKLISHNKKYLNNNKFSILYVKNDGNTDYQSQVNLAVESVATKYFTVVEFDDELSTTYLRNVEKYIKAYDDVDVFLSMIIEVDENNNGQKFTNELVWSQQFIGENGDLGFLNNEILEQYSDFKLSGAVIKKSTFEDAGKYKEKIKLTFMYELLLRLINNGYSIMGIPKLGYKHLVGRENSLFDIYFKTMSMEERKFWFETAKMEFNFTADRDIEVPVF